MNTPTFALNPVTEAVFSYQSHIFNHPFAAEALKNLGAEMNSLSAPQVMILTGPTGVGKSTLVRTACNRVLAAHMDELRDNPEIVPIIAINAVPPSAARFSWKDFYIRLLVGQNEPLVDRKLYLPKQMSLLPGCAASAHGFERSVTDALRRSVEVLLKERKTRLLVIDEAQHILLASNPQRLECQFESLKSLAAETGCIILLVGTYRLLDILDQSAQLTRRCQVVNFPRYDMRRSDHREEFQKILTHFSEKLSQHVPTQLEEESKYFYNKSAGCVGILKDWLGRCLEYALQEKAPQINSAFAERFALTNRGLMTIIEEAFWGEEKLLDVDDGSVIDLLENGIVFSSPESKQPKGNKKPGKRDPKRDAVGLLL